MLNNLSSQLLQDAFGNQWGRARVEWWRFDANGKVDPATHRWDFARKAEPEEDCAVYYCVGLLKSGAKRANENVERVHVLTIDDVGTKLVPDEASDTPEPTWVIETSPGNWQWQYMIEGGMEPADYVALRTAMKASGRWWAKSEATAPANLVRLPQGVNGKPGITHNVWGQGTQKLWKPEDLIQAFAGSGTANAGNTGALQGSSPQRAPDVAAVREILRAIDLKWDGSENSGLRPIWISILHAIKGALPDDEEEAEEIAREWSGPDEPSFDEVWQSLKPTSAGWGLLEIEAKARGGAAMAAEAFDDDAGVLGVGAAAAPHPFDVDQTLVANWIMAQEAGRLKWNVNRKQWVAFDGVRWVLQDYDCAFKLSRTWAGMITNDNRKAAKSANFHTGVEKMLRNEPSMLARETDFDVDPWLAGVPSGTLDLRTGRVRAGRASDMISKSLRAAPAAREACPQWVRFIDEVARGDGELKLFLQQFAGWCLTGDVTDQKLLFLYGPGGNGKSVYLDTLLWLLGEYGVKAMRDVFVLKKNAGHPAELAAMAGARLVVASEVPANTAWDEAVIKDVTGGGTLTARFMRQNPFTFPITFKVACYGNHKPTFPGGVGAAMQRRFMHVEFMFRPKVVDKDLTEKFKAEAGGILRWALNGLALKVRQGLMEPSVVQEATREMFAEADPLEAWMLERTSRDRKAKTSTTDLFKDWNEWRIANNLHGFETVNALSTALKDAKGLEPYRTMTERGFKGLKLQKTTGAASAFDDEERH